MSIRIKRRQFLQLLAALGGGFCAGAGALSARQVLGGGDLSTPASYCRSRPSSPLTAVRALTPDILTIAGSRLFKEGCLDALASAYARDSGLPVTVFGGGCDDGVRSVRSRQAHLGALCCPVPGSPATGLDWLPIAQDLKAVLVHPSNPLNQIGLEELRAIASGRIHRWSEVGGENKPVALVIHRHCDTYFEPVRELLVRGNENWSPQALEAPTDDDHLSAVGRFRTAIGVNSWVLARPLVEAGLLKVLNVDGKLPADALEGRSEYPLAGPCNLILSGWNPAVMTPFFDYLFAPEGQAIIARKLLPVPRDIAFTEGRLNSRTGSGRAA
ncbi:MAG: phosphate ABC transporter substrate-binding protein [Gammaproteobacteria bacterium]|nr:phosphate ABC transporter substrate-binding protein [Gammaproteobacteria bacterium]